MAQESTKDPIIFRFEYFGCTYELSNLTINNTVNDLRAVICNKLNIKDHSSVALKTLQPTRVIMPEEDNKHLSDIFSQKRERIVVENVTYSFGGRNESQISAKNKNERSPSVSSHGSTSLQQSAKHLKSDNNQINSPSAPSQNETVSADQQQNTNDFPVCSSTGYLLRHPVPSNNSCLFISVHFCLTGGFVDSQIGKSMRKIIAETVASDRERFDDAFLGKSNADYCAWILDDNNWGGAIELSILCKFYKTEIVAIDVKNMFMTRFGEDSHYPQRMLLLYDGLHYDPLKFQPLDENQQVLTLFSTENIEVLNLAEELAKEAKQSHQFTDLNSITLKCTVCNAELNSKTASEHAEKTGHLNFTELDK